MLNPNPSALTPISITRSPRRKRSVALHVEKDGSLSVRAPIKTSLKYIESFIAQKREWIEKRRREIAARNATPKIALKDGSEVVFMGQKLRIVVSEKEEGQKGDELHLTLSAPSASSEEIELAFRLWAKKQARLYLPQRTAYWVTQTDLAPARIIVTAPEKRWGSCSAQNDVRLNWRLILAAPEIIDYVIVHELAHIKHKNHGPRFWQRVEKHIPDYKERRKTLRNAEKQGH